MKVRPRKYASGRIAYQVDLGEADGKRVQRSYKTESAALKALEKAEKAQARHGSMASELTGSEMAEIVVAREKAAEAGVSLLEAVNFYLQHAKRMRQEILLSELVSRFVDDRWNEGCSARYRRQLNVSLGSLVKRHPTSQAHEISKENVEAWLKAYGWAAKTRNNYAGDVRACFAWALDKGHARTNPAAGIVKAREDAEEIGTLTVKQCEALLVGALNKQEMMGFVVLGMFCGLRPAEIQRLDWSAVDMQGRTVVVAASQAKTRARRVVDISANAVAWLKAAGCHKLKGPICGRWWDARWRIFRRSLGWAVGVGEKGVKEEASKVIHGEWPHNALRHTYASMHYAMHEDETKLQAQMGHESAEMLHKHYRALKTKTEAKVFWGLAPSKQLLAMLRKSQIAG